MTLPTQPSRRLPLFPLHTVLFPGDTFPLQIFEPRYQKMLADCLDGDGRFGVLLIKAGDEVAGPEGGGFAVTHEVGTVARIIQVNDVGEGRFFLSAEGEQRFRLVSRHEDRPYPAGDVELVEDEPARGDLRQLADEVRGTSHALLKMMTGLGGGWAGEAILPDDPTALSYYVPRLLRIDLVEKQILLEAGIGERLTAEAAMLTARFDALKARVDDDLQNRFSLN